MDTAQLMNMHDTQTSPGANSRIDESMQHCPLAL